MALLQATSKYSHTTACMLRFFVALRRVSPHRSITPGPRRIRTFSILEIAFLGVIVPKIYN